MTELALMSAVMRRELEKDTAEHACVEGYVRRGMLAKIQFGNKDKFVWLYRRHLGLPHGWEWFVDVKLGKQTLHAFKAFYEYAIDESAFNAKSIRIYISVSDHVAARMEGACYANSAVSDEVFENVHGGYVYSEGSLELSVESSVSDTQLVLDAYNSPGYGRDVREVVNIKLGGAKMRENKFDYIDRCGGGDFSEGATDSAVAGQAGASGTQESAVVDPNAGGLHMGLNAEELNEIANAPIEG